MDFKRWYHAAPSFLNMSIEPGHTTKASLFRALEENAAVVSAINLERVAQFSGVDVTGPIVFAGGASKGRLWTQILADVLGREVRVPVVREASALGCAMTAMLGAGDVATLDEAAEAVVRFERTVAPRAENRAAYDEARARWLEAYPPQKALVDAGRDRGAVAGAGHLEAVVIKRLRGEG